MNQLEQACYSKKLNFPLIHAVGVYDSKKYPLIHCHNPHISSLSGRAKNNISIAAWGSDDDDGKASLRRALEAMLQIQPQSRANSIVFDDGPSIVSTAIEEGYQAYLINNEQSLDEAISATLRKAQTKVPNQPVSINSGSQNSFFQQSNSYNHLPSDPEAALAKVTPDVRKRGGGCLIT